MLAYFFVYLMGGVVIGFCAGLFGIGGGIIGIPLLFALFCHQGIAESVAMHTAIGTLLATVVMTSMASIFAHHRSGMILYPVFKKIIWGIMVGCVFGILMASHLNGIYLQRIFGVFLLGLALQYFFNKELRKHDALPAVINIFFVTMLIGILSGLLGLGGGIFIVPYLNWYGISMRNAIATSSACILPVAIIGALGYIFAGIAGDADLAYSAGFVNWLAFFGISITSIIFAPIGAQVAHAISPVKLKRFFAAFLIFVGGSMLLQSFG